MWVNWRKTPICLNSSSNLLKIPCCADDRGFFKPVKASPMSTEKFTEITEENLRIMLADFYTEVQKDPVIGPIFINTIGQSDEDWEPHMDKVVAFWSATMLKTKKYPGGMVMTHNKLKGLEHDHFVRWMQIFQPTVAKHYDIKVALDFTIKGQQILRSLHRNYAAMQERKNERRIQ